MHCPQCGKTYTAVQTVCPSCYVELAKGASRGAAVGGGRVEFGKAPPAARRSEPAPPPPPPVDRRAATGPSVAPPSPRQARPTPPVAAPVAAEAAPAVAPVAVEPQAAFEPQAALNAEVFTEPRADQVARPQLSQTVALSQAPDLGPELEVVASRAPVLPPAPTLVDRWAPEAGAQVSPRRHPGLLEWVLALLLLPGLWFMWARVVKPLAAQAATPLPAVKPSDPITLPAGLTPEDTFKGAQARYQKRDFRMAASEARLALSVWERQGADRATLTEARYFIANACSQAGDYEASLREYDRLLKAEPQNPVFKSEASQVRGQMHKAGRQKAQVELQQARAYFTGKDYTRAVASARSALMLGDQHRADKAFKARCSSLIGRSYYRQGRYREAAAALKQAVTLSPGDSEARAALSESRRQIELANEEQRSRYTYAPQDYGQQPARSTSTRKSSPSGSSSYPRASVGTDPQDQPRTARKRPRGTYNPDYSVPGTKYTPREPQLPTVSDGSANPGGLPSYSQNRDGSLPSYSSGSARSGTLPTYDSNDGGVYPGYQSGTKSSGAPPGY